jgi:hypothetical protein
MTIHCQKCGRARRVVGGRVSTRSEIRETKAESVLVESIGVRRVVEGSCEVCSSSLQVPMSVRFRNR